ncbi:Mov34-domain-containing protein [Atractiella rhizophila]|nr:Mov34-domain-containing protein [Atractiella rhizophila]
MSLPPLTLSAPSSRTVTSVKVSPLVIASLLDHHLRRNPDQDRVFGTLLGTWSESTLHVTSSFGVPYAAKRRGDGGGEFEVVLDQEHHSSMYEMMTKVNSKESIVGWYATSDKLNSFSPLIHNFYTHEVSQSARASRPPIHLTLNPSDLTFKSYSGISLGLRPENAIFKPLPTSLLLDSQLPSAPLTTPTQNLHQLTLRMTSLLDQTIAYVASVNNGEREGDEKVGRALWESVSLLENEERARKTVASDSFNGHLTDVLMVSYLANLLQGQVEVTTRLNLVQR